MEDCDTLIPCQKSILLSRTYSSDSVSDSVEIVLCLLLLCYRIITNTIILLEGKSASITNIKAKNCGTCTNTDQTQDITAQKHILEMQALKIHNPLVDNTHHDVCQLLLANIDSDPLPAVTESTDTSPLPTIKTRTTAQQQCFLYTRSASICSRVSTLTS